MGGGSEVRRPYHTETDIPVYYNNSDLLEDVYDDLQLDENDEVSGWSWENLKQQLGEATE